MIYRRAILLNTKYPIAINSLRTINYDPSLTDPPSDIEFKMSKKYVSYNLISSILKTVSLFRVFFTFHFANLGEIGRIDVMMDSKYEPEIVNHFIQRCVTKSDGYQGQKICKIIKGLLMEIGDGNTEDDVKTKPFFPNVFEKGDHHHCGTLSILLNEDDSVSSKFCVTFKKLPILNGRQIVIGRVIKGLEVLNAINCYGSKFGFPRTPIFIKSCGLIE